MNAPARPEFRVGVDWVSRSINVVFPTNALFTPEQAFDARLIINGFVGEKLDDRTLHSVWIKLETWLDGLLARGELAYDWFEREWRPPSTYSAVQ